MVEDMRTTLFFLLLGWALPGQAQSWFPDEAVWHHGYTSGFGQEGFVRMEVTGDTVLDGLTSRKLVRTRETYDHIVQQYATEILSPVIAHEAEGVVWVHVPSTGAFDTLYHLAAGPGGRWQLPSVPEPFVCTPESFMLVTDTGTMVFGTVALHWIAVDIHLLDPEGVMVVSDTIFERIGTASYILPHDLCNAYVDGQEGGPLRCYQDAEVDHTSGSTPCNFIVGMKGVQGTSSQPLILPNPGGDRIWSVGMDGLSHVTVLDGSGATVMAEVPMDAQGSLYVRSLVPGWYIIIMRTHEGYRHRIKWLKE